MREMGDPRAGTFSSGLPLRRVATRTSPPPPGHAASAAVPPHLPRGSGRPSAGRAGVDRLHCGGLLISFRSPCPELTPLFCLTALSHRIKVMPAFWKAIWKQAEQWKGTWAPGLRALGSGQIWVWIGSASLEQHDLRAVL